MRTIFKTGLIFVLVAVASLAQANEATPQDFKLVAAEIDKTIRAHHYNPSELETTGYLKIANAVATLAETADTKEAFIAGFNQLWQHGPFSHVQLAPARGTATQLAQYLDTLRVGDGAARLSWEGDVAVLTVSTMMGQDTIEQIGAAYAEITKKGAKALIIDLRKNPGGAFAIRPLVAHVIEEPFTAGSFVSRIWNAEHTAAPTQSELASQPAWDSWSIRTFWDDIQSSSLVKVRFTPANQQRYSGPVFVLTSGQTASAAELATDALKASGRATLIGEKTAGQMLSQKPYDISGGFHLSLPIADYYSASGARIEGHGITPHINVPADTAMEEALKQISAG